MIAVDLVSLGNLTMLARIVFSSNSYFVMGRRLLLLPGAVLVGTLM